MTTLARLLRWSATELAYPRCVGCYGDYSEAQRAVDRLAENDFPVEDLAIVGTGLRWEERVRARVEPAATIGLGALSGLVLTLPAWAGAHLGRQLALAVVSAVLGALWGLLAHVVLTGGEHRFASTARIVADRYELFVEHRHAHRARELLVRDARPTPRLPAQQRAG